jgi:hypothetical protein
VAILLPGDGIDHIWNKVEGKVFPLYAVRVHVVVEVDPIALLFLNLGTTWG